MLKNKIRCTNQTSSKHKRRSSTRSKHRSSDGTLRSLHVSMMKSLIQLECNFLKQHLKLDHQIGLPCCQKEHGFYLEKQAFWDTLYLRYKKQLRNLPSHCVCGKTFSIDHALSCPKGGFISLRHNELRDFTAKYLLNATQM